MRLPLDGEVGKLTRSVLITWRGKQELIIDRLLFWRLFFFFLAILLVELPLLLPSSSVSGKAIPPITKGKYAEHKDIVAKMFDDVHASLVCNGERSHINEARRKKKKKAEERRDRE